MELQRTVQRQVAIRHALLRPHPEERACGELLQTRNERARVSKDEDGPRGALMLRDASQRTWAVEAVALTWCCDAPQHEGERAPRILAERSQSSFDQTKRSGRTGVRSERRTNLGLYEITARLVSLFPACSLQGALQLRRVEP